MSIEILNFTKNIFFVTLIKAHCDFSNTEEIGVGPNRYFLWIAIEEEVLSVKTFHHCQKKYHTIFILISKRSLHSVYKKFKERPKNLT